MPESDTTNYNLFDTELILDYLDGILLKEITEKIRQEAQVSEEFKIFVEGVHLNYREADFDREKMTVNQDREKQESLSQFQALLPPKKPNYTSEQLKRWFEPLQALENLIQGGQQTQLAFRNQALTLKKPENRQDIIGNLYLIFQEKTPIPLHLSIIDNQHHQVCDTTIPSNTKNWEVNTKSFHPGIYYLELQADNIAHVVCFYIQK